MNDKNSKKKNSALNSKNLIMLGIITVALVLFSMIVTYIIPKPGSKIDRAAWNEAVSEAEKSAASTQAANNVSDITAVNDDYNQKAKTVNSDKTIPDSTPAENNSDTAQKSAENASDKNSAPEPNTADSKDSSVGASSMQAPVEGAVVYDYSGDELVYSKTMDDWRCHTGVDISAAEGTDVHAAAEGTVEAITDNGMYGSTVIILHNEGLRSIYGNLSEEIPVNVGDSVAAGAIIGKVGNTAAAEVAESPHLHFEVSLNEETVNPHDYLPAQDAPTEE